MFGNEVSIFDAINITISSMAIVFLTLIVISIVLSFFKHIFKQPVKATAPAKPQVNKVEKVVEESNGLSVWIIIAIVAASILVLGGIAVLVIWLIRRKKV